MLRTNIFMTNTVDINPRLTPSHFNATGCRLWCTGSGRSQSKSIHKEPSEIAVVQISRTVFIMKCYHDLVDQIPQKRMLRPSNQWESHCLHRRPHIWNSRTSGASRHENSRLNKSLTFIKRAIPLKTYGPIQVRIHHRYVELAISVGKDSVRQNFSFKTYHMIDDVVVKWWRHSGAVQLTRSDSRKKTGACTFATGVGRQRYLHHEYVVL